MKIRTEARRNAQAHTAHKAYVYTWDSSSQSIRYSSSQSIRVRTHVRTYVRTHVLQIRTYRGSARRSSSSYIWDWPRALVCAGAARPMKGLAARPLGTSRALVCADAALPMKGLAARPMGTSRALMFAHGTSRAPDEGTSRALIRTGASRISLAR